MKTPRRIAISVICLAVVLGTVGCERSSPTMGSKVTGDIGRGRVSGQTYTHDFFGLAITFPEGWHVASQTESEELVEIGADAVSGSDRNLQAAVDASKPRTLTLVSGFRDPPGTPSQFNENIIIMVEQVKAFPGVRDGGDYLELMKTTLNASALTYEYDQIEADQPLGEMKTHAMNMRMQMGGMTIRQRIYAVRMSDYVLSVILSYESDEELAALKQIVDGMKLGK